MCNLRTVGPLGPLGCLKALVCLIASHAQSQLHLLMVHPGQPGLAAKVSRRSSGRKLDGLITHSMVFKYVAFHCQPQQRVFFPFFCSFSLLFFLCFSQFVNFCKEYSFPSFALSLSCSFFAFLNSLFFCKEYYFLSCAFYLSFSFFAFLNSLFFAMSILSFLVLFISLFLSLLFSIGYFSQVIKRV